MTQQHQTAHGAISIRFKSADEYTSWRSAVVVLQVLFTFGFAPSRELLNQDQTGTSI
jgi:hypothetical protein